MDATAEEPSVAVFEQERRRLFSLAYRMLGSVVDGEDIVQDAYIRWARLGKDQRERIRSPAAYLVRLVTHLCIDANRSAHARRMTYVGPWLPEPLVVSAMDPETVGESGDHDMIDELSVAFLVMLEHLSPVERAVFLLKESFGFSYREIAPLVGKTEQNCRQIQRRAVSRLKRAGRVPARPDRDGHERLLSSFLEATRSGEIDALLAVLADDVVSYADGGGKVVAARRPVSGAADVARYLAGLVRLAGDRWELRMGSVNGEAALLTYSAGKLHNVVTIDAEADRIRRIFIIVNPDKLPVGE